MATKEKKILCIEDEQEMLALMRLIFERHGYQVLSARTGPKGLEIIRRERPDVVLLDLALPGMDGWEVHRRIKADPELRDIPIIVVTARSQGIDRVVGLHVAKVDDYITKPFHIQKLVEAVKQVLAGRGMAVEVEKDAAGP